MQCSDGLKALDERQMLKSAQPELCTSTEDYLRQMEETKLEKYWPYIEPYSFKTEVVSMKPDQIAYLLKVYNNPGEKEQQKEIRASIMSGIEEARLALKRKTGNNGFFLRLSTRSMKDVAPKRVRFKSLVEEQLRQMISRETDSNPSESFAFNRLLCALYRASTQALMVETADDAMYLLENSERIQGDLDEAVKEATIGGGSASSLNLIVREFVDFDTSKEFRGFVHKGRFTALTQYNELCFFPDVVLEKERIKSVVGLFMHDLNLDIPGLDSYVVDLVMLDDGSVRIIELNPFAEFAGAGLFSWLNEADRKILKGRTENILGGYLNFEFRIVTSLPDKKVVLTKLNQGYKKLIGDLYVDTSSNSHK
jgi:hypothetical protein